jgi:serine/threonine protein kinase
MDILTPGTLIADRYDVVQALTGGMGVVYLCRDRAGEDLTVALKTFRPEFLPDREARDRFLREGTTWVNLGRHPHIVRAYRVERFGDGRQVYLVLEWIAPPTGHSEAALRGWLQAGQPLPSERALLFALHITRGMRYVTARMPDLVHRDLKPENVLIDSDGQARVTDFGLAMTLLGLDVGEVQRAGYHPNPGGLTFLMTNKGILGTPLYMAPEQWTPGEHLDARTDIYALGCMLYEMLTGTPAFWGKDIDDLEQAHRAGRVGRLPTELPAAVRTLVWHCLDPNREGRFRTWEEVEREIVDLFPQALGIEAPPGTVVPDETRYERVSAGWSYNTIGLSYHDIGKYDAAIDYFEQAVRVGRAEVDAQLECAGLLNLGSTYRALGSFQRAIEFHEDALVLAQKTGDQQTEQRFLDNMGDVYEASGDMLQAVDYYERELDLSRRRGDRTGEALSLEKLGAAHTALGRTQQAAVLHDHALVIARAIADQRLEGHVLCRLADCRLAEGQGQQARGLYEEALKIAWAIGDLAGQAQTMSGLARAILALGDIPQAADLFQRALEVTQETGDRAGSVANLTGLGRTYCAAGDIEQAAVVLENALALARKIGLRVEEMRVLRELAALYIELGQVRRAVQVAEQYLAVAQDLGNRQEEHVALRCLGLAHRQLGDYREAVEYLGRQLNMMREQGDRNGETQALDDLGETFADLGDVRQALDLFKAAVRTARKSRNGGSQASANLHLAQQWARMGKRRNAQRCAEAAEELFRSAGRLEEAQQARMLGERIKQAGKK